jgi:uncharacterized membrane protein
MEVTDATGPKKRRPLDPFRRALMRGLAVLLPPLLTIVILVWVWNTVADYLLVPAEGLARRALVTYYEGKILPAASVPPGDIAEGVAIVDGEPYRLAPDGDFVPAAHFEHVEALYGAEQMPRTSEGIYAAYVERTFLQRTTVVPVFLCAFLLGLYLLGKFLAAGVGRFFWLPIEGIIVRVPLVRNVYSSVKQVTDFFISERELEYTRVVAVEYPRRGIWQLAFATGESLTDISAAANEPMLTVFFPCSPMPFTGFTAVVKRSETLDLNITMEQAIQFMVSCGVVVPANHLAAARDERDRWPTPALPDATRHDVGASMP